MQCSARGGESSRPPGSGRLAADRPPRGPKPAPRRRGQPAKRKRANSTLGQLVSDLIRASAGAPNDDKGKRPLLKTSLKKLLIDAKWNDPDRGALIAAVVTLREIVRAPELYIDSDAAAADPAVPCIFIRREVVGSYPGGFGVLHHGQFAAARTPLEAIAHWMLCSQDDIPAVAAMVAALDGRDTRSSIAKSILSGRKVLNAPPVVPP